MSTLLKVAAVVSTLAPTPLYACNDNGRCDQSPSQFRGASGLLLGTGLPALAAAIGVYWLIKRRRNDA